MVQLTEQLSTLKITPVEIFDLACGTGAVEAEIYASVPKNSWTDLKILTGDVSRAMLDYLKQRGEEAGWSALTTKIVDGSKLDESGVGNSFTHIFVGLEIFVLPPDTIRQLVAKLAPGGTLVVTTWAYLPWFSLLAKTSARMNDGPSLPTEEHLWKALTDGRPWLDAAFVKEQLEEAGL
ncbi:uncharacterized protein M421DRAFT_377826 [Didymella exigua CBS 183.55]|uniref:Uncharacterized protein n=1 Tax=Didymella exigua CBS 183.55 TaxID=1150837 RepID=A0A6A5RUB0_9PLEO|nr:uncharacterized protein M421DRAFT_377826 [Didymella exigua CBS 183.55]KAF1930608.1 hypothetical protein M421DRAFT_377826 [Didymella exigua CBS 183.55]